MIIYKLSLAHKTGNRVLAKSQTLVDFKLRSYILFTATAILMIAHNGEINKTLKLGTFKKYTVFFEK